MKRLFTANTGAKLIPEIDAKTIRYWIKTNQLPHIMCGEKGTRPRFTAQALFEKCGLPTPDDYA